MGASRWGVAGRELPATPTPAVAILGVVLPAADLADALLAHADRQLARHRQHGGKPFNAHPWVETARRAQTAAAPPTGTGQNAQLFAACGNELASTEHIALTDWAWACGVSVRTVRHWAQTGRLAGATQIGGRWLIPADTPTPPARRRKDRPR